MTMRRSLPSRIGADRRGSAAAEMALVAPLLLALMLGSYEMGKYFLDEHVVAKAVRDGARYAARQNFSTMPCGGTATAEAQIKNLVRTGVPTGGTPRLIYWTDPATITVTITCDNTGTYTGIYTGLAGGAHRVEVSAAVPYTPLFGAMGFDATALSLNARSQAAVMGI
jgi:Flp pilus assembly protein TadG